MTVISLDQIVRNILLKRRYPFHYYLEFLVYSKDALRELSFDCDINPIRYKILTLDSNNTASLPSDYVDYARVSARIGQYLHPLIPDEGLDTIPNYNSSFEEQPYLDGVASVQSNSNQQYYLPGGYLSPYWYMVNWDAYGENIGRQFGGVGIYSDTFKIDKTRNIVKVNEALSIAEVVLEYIGNGLDADSSTQIDSYAQAAIEQYAMWQFKENNRTYSAGEAEAERQKYIVQFEVLRARKSDLTIDVLKRTVQKNTIAIKY